MISPRWLVLASAVAPAGFVMGLALGAEMAATRAEEYQAMNQWYESKFEERRLASPPDEEAPVRMRVEIRERRTHLERDEYVRYVRVRHTGEVAGPRCMDYPQELQVQELEEAVREALLRVNDAVKQAGF